MKKCKNELNLRTQAEIKGEAEKKLKEEQAIIAEAKEKLGVRVYKYTQSTEDKAPVESYPCGSIWIAVNIVKGIKKLVNKIKERRKRRREGK